MLKPDQLATLLELGKFREPGKLDSHTVRSVPMFRPANLVVSFQKFRPRPLPPHALHQRCFFKLHLRGSSIANIGGRRFFLNPGDGVVIFPFQPHFIELGGAAEQYRFMCEFDLPVEDLNHLEPLRNHPFHIDAEDLQLLRHVAQCAAQSDGAGALYAWGEFLTRRVQKKWPSCDLAPAAAEDDFAELLNYICNPQNEPLSIKKICQEFDLTEKELRSRFRKKFSACTPGRLLRQLRLYRAAEQLIYTAHPLKAISQYCGFADQFAFCRSFRQFFGCSPRQYRQAHQEPHR